MKFLRPFGNLMMTMFASIVIVILGLLFFLLTTWIVKLAAKWAGYGDVTGNTIILTTGLITAAAIISSGFKK